MNPSPWALPFKDFGDFGGGGRGEGGDWERFEDDALVKEGTPGSSPGAGGRCKSGEGGGYRGGVIGQGVQEGKGGGGWGALV